MAATLYGIIVLVVFCVVGVYLTSDPGHFLAKLGRPATEKHIMATRLIGGGFFLFALLVLLRWLRAM